MRTTLIGRQHGMIALAARVKVEAKTGASADGTIASLGADAGGADGHNSDRIYGHFVSGIFGTLSAPSRRPYSRIILSVYREILRDGVSEGVLKVEFVEAIERAMAVESRFVDPFATGFANASIGKDPNHIYTQLRGAGWFVERRERFSIFVDFDVPVMLLLELFDEVDSGSAMNFTGALMSIEGSIAMLEEDPERRALSLDDCAERSRKFLLHLKNVAHVLRGFHRKVAGVRGRREMIELFFNDYIKSTLISDYQSLATRNNPSRYRNRVLSLVRGLEGNEDTIAALARGYVINEISTPENARSRVLAHLEDVRRAFVGADEQLAAIDAARGDFEKRVMRSMTATSGMQGIAARVTALMAAVESMSGTIDSMLVPEREPIGEGMLTEPRAPRVKPVRRPVVIYEHSPEMSLINAMNTSYLLKTAVSEGRLVDYIEAQLGDADAIESTDFVINDISDFSLFRMVPAVAAVHVELADRYRVVFGSQYAETAERPRIAFPNLVENDWAAFRPFRLERVGASAKDARAC